MLSFLENFPVTSFRRGRVMNQLSHFDEKGQRDMPQRFYGVRKALLIPLGLDVVLLFGLLMSALLLKGERAEKLVFALFFIPTFVLFLASYRRRVTVAEGGLVIRRFWGNAALSWDEITHVGCLTLHRKVYLLLTTVKGFFIVSSFLEGFSALAEEIVTHVGLEKIEEDCRLQAGRAVAGIANVASAWIAATAMIGIILLKLFPFIV
jgi:hypothetical protein